MTYNSVYYYLKAESVSKNLFFFFRRQDTRIMFLKISAKFRSKKRGLTREGGTCFPEERNAKGPELKVDQIYSK